MKINVTKNVIISAIGSFAAAGKLEISRKNDLTPYCTNHWNYMGLCPKQMASGSKTTKWMKLYGPQFGYTFVHDGFTKGGNYINPRLIKA